MAYSRLKPKNDFIFQRLFGERESKGNLIALLNAILKQDGLDPIVELSVLENKELKKLLFSEKTGRLDIRAELASGEQINVEMQIANKHNMEKRTLFYLAKLFTSSIKTGEPFEKLKKTITINLLDYEFLPTARFHSTFHFYEDLEKQVRLTDVLEVHFIEFPKFERATKDKSIALHRWLMFLDEKLPEEELKELMAMDRAIEKIEVQLEELSNDEFTRQLAEARGHALSEWNTQILGSKAEGKVEAKVEIVKNLLNKGLDAALISEVSGLSLQEIKRIAKAAD